MVSDDEVSFYLSGYDSYDQENFLNTGWLLMKHLFSKFEKKNDRKFNKPSRAPSEEIPEAGKKQRTINFRLHHFTFSDLSMHHVYFWVLSSCLLFSALNFPLIT